MAQNNKASKLIRIKHTYQMQYNLSLVQETMDLVNQQFITTVENFKYLASRDINTQDLEKYVRAIFSTKTDDEEKQDECKRVVSKVTELFETGRGSDIAGKNLWGAYNAVEEYLQYEKGNSKTTDESRYDNLWYGDASRLNKKALETALSF